MKLKSDKETLAVYNDCTVVLLLIKCHFISIKNKQSAMALIINALCPITDEQSVTSRLTCFCSGYKRVL